MLSVIFVYTYINLVVYVSVCSNTEWLSSDVKPDMSASGKVLFSLSHSLSVFFCASCSAILYAVDFCFILSFLLLITSVNMLQCFDSIGWATKRASSVLKILL